MKADVRIRMGRRRPSPLRVPGEIFDVYQPLMGVQATLLWLNLRWLEHAQVSGNIEEELQARFHVPFAQLAKLLDELMRFGLLEIGAGGEYVLHEPLSAEAFAAQFDAPAVTEAGTEVAATSLTEEKEEVSDTSRSEPAVELRDEIDGVSPDPTATVEQIKPWATGLENLSADMEAVMDLYHQKIGIAGPIQFEKLRYWVEEQGMEGEVVAAAIEETVQSAQVPRINYLEGVLRNWFNDGIRTLKDLVEKKASKVLSGASAKTPGQRSQTSQPSTSMEGMANADAYRRVDPNMVKKWKELYPDEYDG
ncbi:MAG: DnaD domain protein [Limnochordia bacterium]